MGINIVWSREDHRLRSVSYIKYSHCDIIAHFMLKQFCELIWSNLGSVFTKQWQRQLLSIVFWIEPNKHHKTAYRWSRSQSERHQAWEVKRGKVSTTPRHRQSDGTSTGLHMRPGCNYNTRACVRAHTQTHVHSFMQLSLSGFAINFYSFCN